MIAIAIKTKPKAKANGKDVNCLKRKERHSTLQLS